MALKLRKLAENINGSGEDADGASEDSERGAFIGATEPESGISGIEGNGDGAGPDPGTSGAEPAPVVKKRIGRPPGSKTGAKAKGENPEIAFGPGARSAAQDKLDLGAKPKKAAVKNDRKFVADNAQALHQLVAMFTNSPHWMISPQEASELANKSCDVLDHMGLSVTGGEVGLIGKIVALGLCVYMIEGPRLAQTVALRASGKARPVVPASPMEAAAPPSKGRIDLSGLQ